MRQKHFYLLFLLLMMSSATLFASRTIKEITLSECKGSGMLKPTDSPDQSSDDPPRPNQFHAYIQGQTLSFKISNSNMNHVTVRHSSEAKILDVHFAGDTAFMLPTVGQHVVEIQNGNLLLRGEFTRSTGFRNQVDEPGESLSYSIRIDSISNCYVIEVEYPCFELVEVVLPNDTASNAEPFEQMEYPYYENTFEPFDYGMQNGQPKLPFLSLNLQIPEGSSIDTITESIDYYNDIELLYQYAPVQDVPQTNEGHPLQYDGDYYEGYIDNLWSSPVSVSEPYSIGGTTGINVQMRPAKYFPLGRLLKSIIRIKYIICVTGDQTLLEMYDEMLGDERSDDMLNFYDTYISIDTLVHPNYKGNFLIITTPEFESEAVLYADHKNNLGFNADVQYFSGSYLDSTYIRHWLKSLFDLEECRPQHVLIIGNDIPYSAGTIDDENHPLTDIYYACLDNYDIAYETNITPDIYVGRWPVHNSLELMNVIQKSIYYDLHIPNRRTVLFSGTGNMEDNFAEDNKYVYEIIYSEVNGMTAVNYDGRYGFDDTYMTTEFANHDNLFFIYQGHGAPNNLGEPYSEITKYSLPHNLPYFSIGYACQLNYPNGLGWAWINNGERSCVFYGSAVRTTRNFNSNLERITFRQLTDNKNRTIGSLLYAGLNKTVAHGVTIRNAESYILLGDPSLYIYGIDILTGNPVRYAQENTEDLQNIVSVSNIMQYTIYTISGIPVYSQAVNNNDEVFDINTLNLENGVYILMAETTDNVISSRKIIIQR